MNKSASKKTTKAKQPPSPHCKIETHVPVQKPKKSPNPQPKVITFTGGFLFEVHICMKNNGDEGHVHQPKEHLRGNISLSSEPIDNLNITGMVHQRKPNSNNEKMTTAFGETYPRTIFIRHPTNNESNSGTRQEGLQAIKTFLQDKRFTECPPGDIDLIDLTNENDPPALDKCFMDNDIKTFMEEDTHEDQLNSQFTINHPHFARKCWHHNYISEWGLQTLGFTDVIHQEEQKQIEKFHTVSTLG